MHHMSRGGADWPWLHVAVDARTHDLKNGLAVAPQSSKILALVEGVAALLSSRGEILPRPGLSRHRLASVGIAPDARFVVLHTGARIAFSRWPYFAELCAELMRHTDRTVALIDEDGHAHNHLPAALQGAPRLILIAARLAIDDFDALLTFCDVFVGNDSGPKHLAALRGAEVVSIHSARINWSEWGQEQTGVTISRRVPCAGCALFHDADECGRDYVCVTGIAPHEVCAAVLARLT